MTQDYLSFYAFRHVHVYWLNMITDVKVPCMCTLSVNQVLLSRGVIEDNILESLFTLQPKQIHTVKNDVQCSGYG